MPVHHEKPERKSRQESTEGARNTSIHRTKQREVSLERRPIISQERPPVKPIKRPNKPDAKTDQPRKTTSISTASKNPSTSKVATRAPISKRTVDDTKKKVALIKEDKVKSSNTGPSKPSPRGTTTVKASVSKSVKPAKKGESSIIQKVSDKRKEEKSKEKSSAVESSHVRTKTRTLSPSEVRVLKAPASGKHDVDRVKLSQLSQPNPASLTSHEQLESKEESSEDDDSEDYEDDFEDYESDFEEDTDPEEEDENEESADQAMEEKANEEEATIAEQPARRRIVLTSAEERERERKLDSGSYHISAAPHRREIEEIKTAMQNENRPQRKQLPEEDPDEGYLEEDKKIVSTVLDFSRAEKRSMVSESHSILMKRGEVLSQMITLDTVSYTLLELTAVPYEVFITTYGNSNTSQVHCQTNEDDCDEEIQTDDVDMETRWTQMPPAFDSKMVERTSLVTRQERLGVGRVSQEGELGGEDSNNAQLFHSNTAEFSKFIIKASQNMLSYLQASQKVSEQKMAKSELPCCDTMMSLIDEGKESLPITCIATGQNSILTIQQPHQGSTVIDVWSLTDLKIRHSLICRKEVKTACFEPKGYLVFAGAKDGSVNLWDLRETAVMHSFATYRSPTYSTAQVFGEHGHKASLVNVIVMKKTESDEENDEFAPVQVCSLAENGEIIIWTVVQIQQSLVLVQNEDLGLAPWGRVRLVNTLSFKVSDLTHKALESPLTRSYPIMAYGGSGSELLVADNTGSVLFCSADGSLLRHKYFIPSTTTRVAVVTALSVYPYDRRYFLAGCSDGTIRLHSKEQESPLISLHWNIQETSSNMSVKSIFWMPNKPCMFLALDSSSRLHVWNLAESDIYPQFSLPASKQPFISAAFIRNRFNLFNGSIVLGRADGDLEIHNVITEKDGGKETWKKEAKMFQKYVKIL